MKPLLKPHKNVDWHTSVADNAKTTDFLDKMSAFFTDNNVSRRDKGRKRRAQAPVNRQQQMIGQEALTANTTNGKQKKPAAERPVEITDEKKEKKVGSFFIVLFDTIEDYPTRLADDICYRVNHLQSDPGNCTPPTCTLFCQLPIYSPMSALSKNPLLFTPHFLIGSH